MRLTTRFFTASLLAFGIAIASLHYALPQDGMPSALAQPELGDSQPPQLPFLVPIWIKNNTASWSQGKLDDSQFILGVRYLIANDMMALPHEYSSMTLEKPIPAWIKTVGSWWADGKVSDYDFLASIQYLISSDDIKLGQAGNVTSALDSSTLKNNFPRGKIMVDNVTLEVQVAETQDQMIEGLQFQQALPYNQGMIFVFGEPQVVAMWMKDMTFPLDMIWFDANGNVIHIEKDLPPCTENAPCQVYDGGRQEAKYVLEVTSGFAEKFNVTEKSKLAILSLP